MLMSPNQIVINLLIIPLGHTMITQCFTEMSSVSTQHRQHRTPLCLAPLRLIGDFGDQYTGLREIPENTRQSMLGDVPQYGHNPTHTTREDEMLVLREKIDNLITREEYNKTLLDLSEKVATKDDL
ncbi:PREDICTED: uncharacterized protein LOC108782171, partial [Cyphomyrmex costatus]|uniref:uncharacterized protein LOC108782171 n=1 Tax=Cyphomyrmex costatus TaxID=456900 RepID=UPI00085237E2